MAEEQKKDEKSEKAQKGAKPTLTPEQEAEAAAKKAARAEAKAKGGKGGGKGKGGGSSQEVALERVRRTAPARLRKVYDTEIRGKLISEFSLKNPMEAPRLMKITINMGLGEAVTNPKVLDTAVEALSAITSQRHGGHQGEEVDRRLQAARRPEDRCDGHPSPRSDVPEFLDRLVSVRSAARVRDFRRISPKSFDGRGNYTLGIREEIIFPEINYERLEKPKGMNITFTTTARTDEQGRALLRHLGMPFRN